MTRSGNSDVLHVDNVPFNAFVSLLEAIAKVEPQPTNLRTTEKASSPALDKFRLWMEDFRERYPNPPKGTTGIIFKLLFPEEDTARKYHMREEKLSDAISAALGVSDEGFKKWNQTGFSGCLGLEVRRVMQKSETGPKEDITLHQINEFLDELAAICPYSDKHIRDKFEGKIRRKRAHIIRDVFGNLSSVAAGFLVEIILKDMKPILYRVPEGSNRHDALMKYNQRSFYELSMADAMWAWGNTLMYKTYKARATIDATCMNFENGEHVLTPIMRTPVLIPRSVKGLSARHAIGCYDSSIEILWAEIKYDGERAQIHIEYNGDEAPKVTIFSKSQRNSTEDRQAVHDIARWAVFGANSPGLVKRNVILDAEMVAYNDEDHRIDEFWRIRDLVGATASGPRARSAKQPSRKAGTARSLESTDEEKRHLALVFFDVLYLDDESLLDVPYCKRRALLESILRVTEGEAMLSKRFPVDMRNRSTAEDQLNFLCAEAYGEYEEGLMLKADNGGYNKRGSRWVKMKRDYIPDLGDTLDIVVLGAGWNKQRASGLHVTTDVLTTIYLGAVTNIEAIKEDPKTRPHFNIYFTSEYGAVFTRESLELHNFWITSADHVNYHLLTESGRGQLDYDFTLLPGLAPPRQLLRVPLAATVYGAGYTISRGSRHYELRFPRLTSLYRSCDRKWQTATSQQDIDRIGREACGKDIGTHRATFEVAKLFYDSSATSRLPLSVRDPKTILRRTRRFYELLSGKDPSLKRTRDYVDTIGSSSIKRNRSSPQPRVNPSKAIRTMSLMIPARSSPLPARLSATKSESVIATSEQCSGVSDQFKNSTLWTFCGRRNDAVLMSWKSQMHHRRYIHEADAVLTGCGWTHASRTPWVERGLVVVDQESEAKIVARVKEIGKQAVRSNRVPIWIVMDDATIHDGIQAKYEFT